MVIPILEFAYRLGFSELYDWQARILMRYELGDKIAAACANYTGKTSVIFPICALWTLYNFPTARLMYMSATYDQVVNQFFSGLRRFEGSMYTCGWQFLESEVRTGKGGFLFGRASDIGGHIEGIHDRSDSLAGLLVDGAKTIREEIFDTLERCHVTWRLFASSTGPASGGFYRLWVSGRNGWVTFRVPSELCKHVSGEEINEDRVTLKDSVWRIKHGAEWLYDAGDAMISLEHVRALLADPPKHEAGKTTGFCDFAGAGDEALLAVCEGNQARIVEAWRHRDTMHSVKKFISLFRRLGLKGYQIGKDEGYGHQLTDRMAGKAIT